MATGAKVYDGSPDAAGYFELSDNRVPDDVFSLDYSTALFNSENVSEANTITVSGIHIESGIHVDNYTLMDVVNEIDYTTRTADGTIVPRLLEVTAVATGEKIYNGSPDAEGYFQLNDNRVPDDVFTLD